MVKPETDDDDVLSRPTRPNSNSNSRCAPEAQILAKIEEICPTLNPADKLADVPIDEYIRQTKETFYWHVITNDYTRAALVKKNRNVPRVILGRRLPCRPQRRLDRQEQVNVAIQTRPRYSKG
ncbi:hypothetical protein MMC09_006883 [Bachmanniomyces sp. S44760]|nr:hypothetical protein [Bachmanniomyces sp. S44760]